MRIDEVILFEAEDPGIKQAFKNNANSIVQQANKLVNLTTDQLLAYLKKYKFDMKKAKELSRKALIVVLSGLMLAQAQPALGIENQVNQYTQSAAVQIPDQEVDKYAQYKASLPESKIRFYFDWIASKSKLNTDIPLPKIYVVGDDILMKELYGSSSSGEPVKVGNPDAVMAFFDDVNGGDTIYIRKKFWDKQVIFQNKYVSQVLVDSVVVHELYHYVQHMNGYKDVGTMQCAASAEPNAYRLQNLWLKEHGSDFKIGEFIIYMSSICEPEDM